MSPRMPPLTPEHRERLFAAAPQLAREAGYRLVVLFGSAARGEPQPEDLDVGILAEGALDTVDATNRFVALLHTDRIDVADLGRADPVLLAMAARDGVPLFEARRGEFARFCSLAMRRYADTRHLREQQHQHLREQIARLRAETA